MKFPAELLHHWRHPQKNYRKLDRFISLIPPVKLPPVLPHATAL